MGTIYVIEDEINIRDLIKIWQLTNFIYIYAKWFGRVSITNI